MAQVDQSDDHDRNHSLYEAKYRAFYDAGVQFVSDTGFGSDYGEFLKGHISRGRLLECGCGEGFAAAYAASLGYEVVGIDSAQSAITRAEQVHMTGHSNLRFVNGDVCELNSMGLGSFDLVADIGCLHMISHPDDVSQYLSDVFHILRPEGEAFFQNRVSPEEANRWFPRKKEWIENWEQRINQCNSDVECQCITTNERTVELQVPVRLGAIFRDVAEYVSLLTKTGFEIRHVCAVSPGVNSPFEVVITAMKLCATSDRE